MIKNICKYFPIRKGKWCIMCIDFLSNIFLITLDSNAMSQFKYILVSFIIKKLQQCPGNSVTNILIYLLTYRWWIHIMHTNSSSLLINFNCIEMFPASICVWPHSYKKSNRSNRSQHFFKSQFHSNSYFMCRSKSKINYLCQLLILVWWQITIVHTHLFSF